VGEGWGICELRIHPFAMIANVDASMSHGLASPAHNPQVATPPTFFPAIPVPPSHRIPGRWPTLFCEPTERVANVNVTRDTHPGLAVALHGCETGCKDGVAYVCRNVGPGFVAVLGGKKRPEFTRSIGFARGGFFEMWR
jgi:hypothetical protein